MDGREGDFEDEDGPHSVEYDLKGAEEGLAEDGVEEEGLEGGGKVRVEPVDAEGFVVCKVVRLVDISFTILTILACT